MVCGTALVITSHTTLGGSLVGLSLLTSFFKWSMALQEAQKAKQAQEVFLTGISGLVNEFLMSRGIMYAAGNKSDGSLH